MKTHQTQLLPLDHATAFRNIRNYLSGRFIGATRDRELMEEMFKCVFAKHLLMKGTILAREEASTSRQYRNSFGECKRRYPGIFEDNEEIQLDPAAIQFVDEQLSSIDLEGCRADIFSEIYEIFGASGIKSSEGQFFTPQVAVNFLVDLVKPDSSFKVCDPACGAGGFLIAVAKYWVSNGLAAPKAAKQLFGFDKDLYLSRFSRGRLSLFLDEMPSIVCGDSLAKISHENKSFKFGTYNAVFTNPPFGAKIVAASDETLRKFDLGVKWEKEGDLFVKNSKLLNGATPQILFLERCLDILAPGGYLGIILPESLVSSKSYSHVVQYLKEKAELLAVVGMPEALFKTSGKTGTHTKTVALVARRKPSKKHISSVFFAEAKWCGHDSRGRIVEKSDIPEILKNYKQYQKTKTCHRGHFGVTVPYSKIGINLAPRRFEFDIETEQAKFNGKFLFRKFGDFLKEGKILLSTGDEVGKLAYGSGDIPFIRTSDISNWEVKVDPKQRVSKEIYEKYAKTQDVRAEDLLMVRDGTYLIGTAAIVTDIDLPMVFQSHIYKIRITDRKAISPYLLLALLSASFVRRQIKSFCVSQDIIDSLGDKINDILLPIPAVDKERDLLIKNVKDIVKKRASARKLSQEVLSKLEAGVI